MDQQQRQCGSGITATLDTQKEPIIEFRSQWVQDSLIDAHNNYERAWRAGDKREADRWDATLRCLFAVKEAHDQ